ncbi:DUF3114 domain-containing protein [Streptococcus parasanguinis]|uniref:DUF3114 domain-containing protein n=2 Tax=Streptococcus parasanguinis TaxID=1318 RepID=UPI001D0610B5|nr:DUF3114 domain-containing protein [Streptococcus parasanguinis]MCB6704618.1 DUF3114 domain-containing protein [Streptococcus parasanguinis]MCB6739246.1 DUF3114 domain-containing protein [Streptococcus parasanguinis]MCB7321546.1 DUF3114 domain-containing protein [Streptococcus parasanguinis]MCB7401045.1 DUF3114 domain-containing protein [Streptococcus parasanguinis]
MGIEVYRGSLDSQASSTGTMIEQQLKAYESLETSLTQIENSASRLSGQAYDSFRSFVTSVVQPLKEAGVALVEATQESVKKLPASYRSEVADEDLQEEKLVSDIEQCDRMIAIFHAEINEIAASKSTSAGDFQRLQRLQRIQGLNVLESIFKATKNKLQEKLNKLRAFNASSPSIFWEIDVLAQAIQIAVNQINVAWNPNTGMYSIPKDLSWSDLVNETIKNKEFENEYLPKKPKDVTAFEYNKFLTGLREQSVNLKEKDGWDKDAIKAYVKSVSKRTTDVKTASELNARRDALYAETKEIGSDIYTEMYAASKLDSKAKIELVLKQLGAETDGNQFMHLTSKTHKISENLAPHGDFNMYFRRDVVKAFGDKHLNYKKDLLRQQVHFFRYYLDRQAIYYIRNHYEGATDYEKLLAYGKENNIEFDYTTGSNYHNRFNPKDGFKRPYNMKVQVPQGNSAKGKDLNNARMVEFIVNIDTGEFDSQWDAYDKHKLADGSYNSDLSAYSDDEFREIANTESFNYGPSKGQNSDVTKFYKGKHGMLDVDGTPEPATRSEAKKQFHSESDLGDVDKDTGHVGQFADIVRKGGHEDYEAWQRKTKGMSEKEKEEEYNKFKASLNGDASNNNGYSYYIYGNEK